MMRLRTIARLIGLPCALVLASGQGPSEYQIKSAFLVNFARFVEWPAGTFASPNDPIVLTVFGKDDPFNGSLDEATRGKTFNGRPLVIRHTTDVGMLRSSHIVFLAGSESRRLGEVVRALDGLPVLFTGESERFASQGGMIGFVVRNEKVALEINLAAATHARLQLSAKLLQVATIVGR